MSCFKKTFIIIKLLLILSLNTAFAKDNDKIIAAKVNDHIISAKDVLLALDKLPPKIKQQPLGTIYTDIVNELVNQHLITKQAYKEKFDQNKEVLSEINKVKDQIIAKFWLKNYIRNSSNKENIKKLYNDYLKKFKSSKEFNASHILVKEKKVATAIITKLNKKVSFSDLAKEWSIGPSAKNGGNLGWFGAGQMVQEFEKATFLLKKNQFTIKPVKTKFGFHIIKLNNIRVSKPKDLSKIKPQIIKLIRKKSLIKLEKEIQKNQKIVINDFKDVAKQVKN